VVGALNGVEENVRTIFVISGSNGELIIVG
jgi:hypothetical protein